MFEKVRKWWGGHRDVNGTPGDKLRSAAAKIPLPELIRRTRIVVIDDKKSEFPFEPLQHEGYAIIHWKDVDDLAKLESGFFDIIVLDINGVGRKLDGNAEGAGVLRHLKERNPSQVIVAYSGQAHDPARIPFFMLADQFVPKPTNMLAWKEILDNLIQEKVSINNYWSTVSKLLTEAGATDEALFRLEKALLAAAKSDKPIDAKAILVSTLGTTGHVVNLATTVAKIIALLYGGT